MTLRTKLLIVALVSIACGCGPPSTGSVKHVIVWHPLGSWSGHGNRQSESFTSDTGALRVRWETMNEISGHPGVFRLTAHSAISGRPLQAVVDQPGVGRGTSYVNQDPHVFYMVVESANVDWSFTVEEAVAGTVAE